MPRAGAQLGEALQLLAIRVEEDRPAAWGRLQIGLDLRHRHEEVWQGVDWEHRAARADLLRRRVEVEEEVEQLVVGDCATGRQRGIVGVRVLPDRDRRDITAHRGTGQVHALGMPDEPVETAHESVSVMHAVPDVVVVAAVAGRSPRIAKLDQQRAQPVIVDRELEPGAPESVCPDDELETAVERTPSGSDPCATSILTRRSAVCGVTRSQTPSMLACRAARELREEVAA